MFDKKLAIYKENTKLRKVSCIEMHITQSPFMRLPPAGVGVDVAAQGEQDPGVGETWDGSLFCILSSLRFHILFIFLVIFPADSSSDLNSEFSLSANSRQPQQPAPLEFLLFDIVSFGKMLLWLSFRVQVKYSGKATSSSK